MRALTRQSSRLLQAGFSLVELMIALVIGSVMIAGAVYVYSQSRSTYTVNDSMARLQEEGRYALSMMEPDIQLAGYYGYTNAYDDVQLVVGGVSTPAIQMQQQDPAVGGLSASIQRCGRNYAVDFMATMQGSNNGFVLGPGASAPGGGSGCATMTPAAAADTFTVRRIGTVSVAPQANMLQAYINRLQPTNQQLFVNGVAPGTIAAGLREVHNVVVKVYYVSQDSDGRPGFPSLRVISLGAGEAFTDQELVPGVEDMQVQFGVDTGDYNNDGVIDTDLDSNGIPDNVNGIATRYVNPNSPILQPPPAGISAQIVTVRIWLRLRAEQPETAFIDNRNYVYADQNYTPPAAVQGFRRLLVTRTIYLRNARTL
jgi:type IV pilus assembly protein PilW